MTTHPHTRTEHRHATQTGIPIEQCQACGHRHPITRTHCTACGMASITVNPATGTCHRHTTDTLF